MKRIFSMLLGASLAVFGVTLAQAQAYPNRQIQMIVTGPPGGGSDLVARQMAQALSVGLAQPVIVVNKPGGGGVIAHDFVAKSVPDGYTIFLATSGHPVHPYLHKKLPYDAQKDFVPIAKIGGAPFYLMASAGTGVKTLGDFKAYVARTPDKVSFAVADPTTWMATSTFLSAMRMKDALLVNFKGTGPAMNDVAAGHVPFFMVPAATVLPFRGSGRVLVVGAASSKRSALFPEVPTLEEQGTKVESEVWYCLLAPANTPEAVLDRLSAEVEKALRQPELVDKLRVSAIEPAVVTRQQFTAFMKEEHARAREWAKEAKPEAQ